MAKKAFGIIFLIFSISILYNNCSGWKVNKAVSDSAANSSSDPNANSPNPPNLPANATVADKAMALLAQQCGLCHGPQTKLGAIPFDVTSWDSMVTQNKVVVANNLAGSVLYSRMIGAMNPMPTTGMLPADDIKLVADWIMAGAPKPGAAAPMVEVFDPAKTPKTYVSVKKFILDGKCLGCHGAVKAEENVRYDTYALTLRTVNNGKLVGEIQNNSMPPQGDRAAYPAVTAVELQFIRDWIALGAPET